MNAPRDVSYDGWLTEGLKDPLEAAAYVEAVLELEDQAALGTALRLVAKAHGVAEVAQRADVGEKTLLRSLGDNGNPSLATLQRVLHAVGLRLSVHPA